DRPELAATIYGMSTPHGLSMVMRLAEVLDQLRAALGDEEFESLVATGAAMEFDEAMECVRREIASARRELASSSARLAKAHRAAARRAASRHPAPVRLRVHRSPVTEHRVVRDAHPR